MTPEQEFQKAVADMRKHQKNYFKHRTTSALEASKAAERKVDKMLEEITGDAGQQQSIFSPF